MGSGKCLLGCECGHSSIFVPLSHNTTDRYWSLCVCCFPLLCPKINLGWCFQGHVYCKVLPVILSGTALGILLNLNVI